MIVPTDYGFMMNMTTCATMCKQAFQPDILKYQKIVTMLGTLVIGLAILLLLKGKKNDSELPKNQ